MPLSNRTVFAATCVIGFVACTWLAADPIAKEQDASISKMAQPEYDQEGKLLRPIGFEKWVVVGTSVGLDYSDGDDRETNNPGTIHNVYLQPEAFDHYVRTGEFPEQSVFIVTNHQSLPAKTKGPVSRSGYVAAPTSGLEISVKDRKRFDEGWGYFIFHDAPGKAPNKSPNVRSAAKAFAQKDCFDCHAEHGEVDNVFTQFYSVLTTAREKHVASPQ